MPTLGENIQVLDTLTGIRTWDNSHIRGEIVDGIYHNHYEWENEDSELYHTPQATFMLSKIQLYLDPLRVKGSGMLRLTSKD